MRTLLIFLTLTGLSGCQPHSRQANIAGAANPASVYCTQQGGMRDTVREHGINVTYCIFPTGDRVDEWSYFMENVHNAQIPRTTVMTTGSAESPEK